MPSYFDFNQKITKVNYSALKRVLDTINMNYVERAEIKGDETERYIYISMDIRVGLVKSYSGKKRFQVYHGVLNYEDGLWSVKDWIPYDSYHKDAFKTVACIIRLQVVIEGLGWESPSLWKKVGSSHSRSGEFQILSRLRYDLGSKGDSFVVREYDDIPYLGVELNSEYRLIKAGLEIPYTRNTFTIQKCVEGEWTLFYMTHKLNFLADKVKDTFEEIQDPV